VATKLMAMSRHRGNFIQLLCMWIHENVNLAVNQKETELMKGCGQCWDRRGGSAAPIGCSMHSTRPITSFHCSCVVGHTECSSRWQRRVPEQCNFMCFKELRTCETTRHESFACLDFTRPANTVRAKPEGSCSTRRGNGRELMMV